VENLKRFWFVFDTEPSAWESIGCGVTARSRPDAEELMRATVFLNHTMPPISDVDLQDGPIDRGSFIPQGAGPDFAPDTGDLSVRGIWWPRRAIGTEARKAP
jgi:hypothetical protein